MSSPIPTLREYGEYLESLDRPLAANAMIGAPAESEAEGLDAAVVDVRSARSARRDRRRWLVAAAAAVAIVVTAAALLVPGAGDRGIRTGPAGPSPAPTTAPTLAPGVATSDPAFAALLQSAGATPSLPESGELVASAWRPQVGTSFLYADGRLISTVDVSSTLGWVEQRLTPEGVERVRAAFLASGVFDPGTGTFGDEPTEVFPSTGVLGTSCFVCVRDGDRLLTRNVQGMTPEEDQAVVALAALPATLPPTDWVQQAPAPYAPARYSVCFSAAAPSEPPTTIPLAERPAGVPDVPSNSGIPLPEPPDLPEAMQALPPAAAALLNGVDDARKGWDAGLNGGSYCWVLTTGEARVLAIELANAFGGPPPPTAYQSSTTTFGFAVDTDEPHAVRFDIGFWALLPDRSLAFYYPAKH